MTDKATVTVDLAQLRALEAAATAEPWEADVFAVVVVHGASTVNVASQILDADAALVVFLRNNAAAMADENETLRARLAEAEADATRLATALRLGIPGHAPSIATFVKRRDDALARHTARRAVASHPEASS